MQIFGNYEPVRRDRPVSPAAPANVQGLDATASIEVVPRADLVQSCQSDKSPTRKPDVEYRDTLDPERTAELRRRVLEGAYSTLEVVDQVARRILQRGDL